MSGSCIVFGYKSKIRFTYQKSVIKLLKAPVKNSMLSPDTMCSESESLPVFETFEQTRLNEIQLTTTAEVKYVIEF